MLDLMYTIPSQDAISECVITREVVDEPQPADHALQEGRLGEVPAPSPDSLQATVSNAATRSWRINACRCVTSREPICTIRTKASSSRSSRCGTWWSSLDDGAVRRRPPSLDPGARATLSTTDKRIFLATQNDPQIDDPSMDEIYRIGVVATVVQNLKLPNRNVKVMVEGVARGEIVSVARSRRLRHRRACARSTAQVPDHARGLRSTCRSWWRSSSSTPRCRTTWRSRA